MKLDIWKYFTGPPPAELGAVAALLAGRELAAPVAAEGLEMIPILGSPVAAGVFAPPGDAITLERVTRYGTMILENRDDRPAIVPLQLGYLQKAVQNHAMCTAGLLAPRGKATFTDACCIQQGQGGLMTANEDRFIVLPHPLRAAAFALRGQESYGKLWGAIASLNGLLSLKARGHLDELKHERQADLVRLLHWFEPVPGQTGAVFSFNGEWVGLELAPDATFWSQLHAPLIMYCYAPVALVPSFIEGARVHRLGLEVEGVASLAELERRLAALTERRKQRALEELRALGAEVIASKPEQHAGAASLLSIQGRQLAGQVVLHRAQPAYTSVFSTAAFRA